MKLLSIDCESNGLYGNIWAIGAVVIDQGKEVALFEGALDPKVYVTDQWVHSHVVQHCLNLQRYLSEKGLLRAFWKFWLKHRKDVLALADFGAPVEAYLFRRCMELGIGEEDEGPYPLHELGTLLWAFEIDPDIDRFQYSQYIGEKHNPVEDARAAAYCWIKIMRKRIFEDVLSEV